MHSLKGMKLPQNFIPSESEEKSVNHTFVPNDSLFLGKGELYLIKDGKEIPLGNVINFHALAESVRKATIAINSFARVLGRLNNPSDCVVYSVADMKKTYLQNHSKLPGSNRTKRLRKKQTSLLYKWWIRHESNL